MAADLKVLLLALVVCCCAALSRGQQSDGDLGWIVSGPNHTPDGLPTCSFCINVVNAVFFGNWTDLRVGMYRCLKQDSNELWTMGNGNNNSISIRDFANNRLCLDAGSLQPDYRGQNVTLLPLLLRPCDGSRRQRWYLDAKTKFLRSNLTDSDGSLLYMAQGHLEDLPGANDTEMSANYNLYLSTLPALATTPGFITSNFTFQPVSNYRASKVPGLLLRTGSEIDQGSNSNLLRNGGFEATTLLMRWPAGQNCSTFTKSCSRQEFFEGELFALCSWTIVSPPEVVYDRAPSFKSAEGISSLLLSQRASVNQTFPSQPGSEYQLSFSLAGYLEHSPSLDSFVVCSNQTVIVVTAQIDFNQPALFELENGEVSKVGQDAIWVTRTLTFKATTNATTVTFSSLGSSACGPVLDNVQVALAGPLPLPITPTSSFSGSGSKSNVGVAVGAALGGFVVLLLLLLGLACLWRRHQHKRTLAYLTGDQSVQHVKVFSYAQIEKATANWGTVIGEGGFSKVYGAEFPDGTVGAVKVEKTRRSKSSVFKKELEVLLRVSHRHLVNLIGFCAEKEHPILVFEYLPNGNLCDRLHNSSPDVPPLSWQSRMKITFQVATALKYLHHGTSPPIGHRDIKSANVLLTATDSAKLADFGLSKSAPPDASAFQTVQTDVKGSLGYLDPRYVRSGVYSLKSDVYSYGVVVLELLTGHPAIKDMDLLPFWAAKYINEPLMAHEMLDSRLDGDYNSSDLQILVDLVKMCLQDDSQQRPTMMQVVTFLVDSHFSGCPPACATSVPGTIRNTNLDDNSSSASNSSSFVPSSTVSPSNSTMSI